ncbi:helix-turn-helix transcriptional regulator [Candidatus Pacearchaeota archaeon]|nr:helix-turn-helix transcriptional regulator [Candidatus Pacearchaeota archaeon]
MKNYKITLSKDDAYKIRRMYGTKQFTQKQLSERFNTTQSNISMIINGKRRVMY